MYKVYPLTFLWPYDRQIKACCRLGHSLYPCLISTEKNSDTIASSEVKLKTPCPTHDPSLDDSRISQTEQDETETGTQQQFFDQNEIETGTHRQFFGNSDAKDHTEAVVEALKTATCFTTPAMNEKQKMASAEFLNSPRGTVTLVQGPPGTGKTTLLIATSCKFLESHQQPRLFVCSFKQSCYYCASSPIPGSSQ